MGARNLTLQEVVTGHRKLWDYLADTGGIIKSVWPGWKHYPECANRCFGCQYANQQVSPPETRCLPYCEACPFDWPGGQCTPDEHEGLFGLWLRADTVEERVKWAEAIRDVPLKVEYAELLEEEILRGN